jgi:four helix bundle protein
MQDFRNLLVWQKAHQLALLTYRLTADFPRDEMFGLRSSLRRVSVDIPSYIAEEAMKSDDAEFAKSLSAALGFANRWEYYALLARGLTLIRIEVHETYEASIIEVKKMLNKFGSRLRGRAG